MQLEGMIFDLDGTLADTIPMALGAFRDALRKVGRPPLTDHEIMAHFGPTEEGILRRLVSDRWPLCLRFYLEAYERRHSDCPAPFRGMKTALRLLRQRGLLLAIVTGKSHLSAEISLRHLDLARYFDAVETGSADGNVKSASLRKVLARWGARPHRVAYLGDSVADIKAAKEVGLLALGAAWATTADFDGLSKQTDARVFGSVAHFLRWIRENVETPTEEVPGDPSADRSLSPR